MSNNLGKTLLIVNPVAQSGKSYSAGLIVFDMLTHKFKQDVDVFYTKHKGHACTLASDAQVYDSVIVVGGDGVVHETVCGLMTLEPKDRPILGVIPVGSGDDFARSLKMTSNYKKAVKQIMNSNINKVDIGKCNDEYFAETLSFGLDAGIAIDTMHARKKSREKGFKLYFKCGVNRIKNHFEFFKFSAVLDNERKLKGRSLIFAIQNGKTYGGSFKITPKASLDDGVFDICYSVGELSRKVALPLFARAAKGKHTSSKHIAFDRASTIEIKLDRIVPAQVDGEELFGAKFTIEVIPMALRVYNSIYSK